MTRICTATATLAVIASLAAGCGNGSDGSATTKRAAAHTAPALGGRIAFRRYFDSQQSTGAVFTINPDGSNERQLTHPPAATVDDQPAWSPDGKLIAFSRCSDESGCSVFLVNADGSHPRRLVPCHGKIATLKCPDTANVTFAADGKHVLLTAAWGDHKQSGDTDQIENSQVWLVDLHGRTTKRLLALSHYRGDAEWGTLSPDGRMLAYEWNVSLKHQHTIMVVNLASGSSRRVIPWSMDGGDNIQWSRDGSRILFRSHEEGHEGSDYYTVRPDGSGLTRLTHFKNQSIFSAAWSPDGKWITFGKTGRDGQPDVFVMKADGTGIRPVTRTRAWESAAEWGRASA